MINSEFTREENITFWKNLFLIGVFFLLTPLTVGVSLFSLMTLKSNSVTNNLVNISNQSFSSFSGAQVYASLPSQPPSVGGSVGVSDARGEIVRQYLAYYDSPLTPFADNIIQISDKYNLDYRLLPAIAQQESNLCKVIPPGSYNCWGWGINSQSNLAFKSYPDGLDTVAKGLRTQYLDKGFRTVNEIMSKYNPNSPNAAWAKGVSEFMNEME